MPITENTFTADEVSAAIAANPTLIDPLKSVLTANKFAVRTADEETAFLSNHEGVVASRKTLEHATALEKDTFEATGIAKKDGEKYYDYFKRAMSEKIASTKTLEEEIKALKDKPGATTAADLKRIEALENKIAENATALQTLTETKDKEIFSLKAENQLEKDFASLRLKYKADIAPSIVKIVEDNARKQLLASSKLDENGNLVFLDDKGVVILNPTTMKPQTADVLLAESLKDLIDTGRKQGGAGSGAENQGGTGGTGGTGKFTTLPASVTTQVQLTEHLLKLGYMDDSADFMKIIKEHGEKLPLR